jgi:hypothetical protein
MGESAQPSMMPTDQARAAKCGDGGEPNKQSAHGRTARWSARVHTGMCRGKQSRGREDEQNVQTVCVHRPAQAHTWAVRGQAVREQEREGKQ